MKHKPTSTQAKTTKINLLKMGGVVFWIAPSGELSRATSAASSGMMLLQKSAGGEWI
jgi:hypothetical protein